MLIQKFGGTSVGSAERMRALIPLIASQDPKIVVLSAMAGTTNQLVAVSAALYKGDQAAAAAMLNELEGHYHTTVDELLGSAREKGHELITVHFNYLRDIGADLFTAVEEKAVLAQGELLSTALVQFYLEEQGYTSVLLPALNFMRLDANDEPDLNYIETHLKQELEKYPGVQLFITQGYICRNTRGETDNLKRGGSDYTATLIGAALNASEIQIWTDIDGMHNNDPRIVPHTFPVQELSFDEAAELAYFGAKILHPTCVLPAQKRNVPVRLLNTMQPEAQGTRISSTFSGERITAVAAKDGITAINIRSGRMLLAYGFLRSVFEVFERYRTPIDLITTSEVAVSLTIDDNTHLAEISAELAEFGEVTVDHNQTIVCIVGSFGADTHGYASRVFAALKQIPIRMISYGGSAYNISLLVATAHKKETLLSLSDGLFIREHSTRSAQ
ncbi:MAG: aspartate kinase [Bacteroidota bacterium]